MGLAHRFCEIASKTNLLETRGITTLTHRGHHDQWCILHFWASPNALAQFGTIDFRHLHIDQRNMKRITLLRCPTQQCQRLIRMRRLGKTAMPGIQQRRH